MIIFIIGEENHSRWSVQIHDKKITLNGCDFLILSSLAVVFESGEDAVLNKDLLFGDLTARYIYRLKQHIKQLSGYDFSKHIINMHQNGRRKAGCYQLNDCDVIVEHKTYLFDDNRFQIVLDKYGKSE